MLEFFLLLGVKVLGESKFVVILKLDFWYDLEMKIRECIVV